MNFAICQHSCNPYPPLRLKAFNYYKAPFLDCGKISRHEHTAKATFPPASEIGCRL